MWQSFLNYWMSLPQPSWGLEILKVLPSTFVALIAASIAYRQYRLAKDANDLTGDARYLAIRVVCLLDQYVEDCAMVASDSGEEDGEGVTYTSVKAPARPTYPDDVNWKSIDFDLMYKLFSLPVAADRAVFYVDGAAENSGPPDYDEVFQERIRQYVRLGLQAHNLSQLLKKKYAVALDVVEHPYWNPVETLQKKGAEQKERDDFRAEAQNKFQKGAPPFEL